MGPLQWEFSDAPFCLLHPDHRTGLARLGGGGIGVAAKKEGEQAQALRDELKEILAKSLASPR